jgi:hypothetical protein
MIVLTCLHLGDADRTNGVKYGPESGSSMHCCRHFPMLPYGMQLGTFVAWEFSPSRRPLWKILGSDFHLQFEASELLPSRAFFSNKFPSSHLLVAHVSQ